MDTRAGVFIVIWPGINDEVEGKSLYNFPLKYSVYSWSFTAANKYLNELHNKFIETLYVEIYKKLL